MCVKLKTSSNAAFDRLSKIEGLKPIRASAAMYMMCNFDRGQFEDIENDMDFCQKLLTEQNCFVFPSSLFGSPDGFRIILCTQPETLIEFGDRLEEFCKVHVRKSERKQITQ